MEAVALAVPEQQEQPQPLTRLHANGESHTFTSIEAAHAVCPVLGSMSLKEAQVLYDYEEKGRALMQEQAASQDAAEFAPPEPPKKIRKIKKIAKPIVAKADMEELPDVEQVLAEAVESAPEPVERRIMETEPTPTPNPEPAIIAESKPVPRAVAFEVTAQQAEAPPESAIHIEPAGTQEVPAVRPEVATPEPVMMHPGVEPVEQRLSVSEPEFEFAPVPELMPSIVVTEIAPSVESEVVPSWVEPTFAKLLEQQKPIEVQPAPEAAYVAYDEAPQLEPVTLEELIAVVPVRPPSTSIELPQPVEPENMKSIFDVSSEEFTLPAPPAEVHGVVVQLHEAIEAALAEPPPTEQDVLNIPEAAEPPAMLPAVRIEAIINEIYTVAAQPRTAEALPAREMPVLAEPEAVQAPKPAEQLTELFEALCEELEIEATPDVIASLVELTLRHQAGMLSRSETVVSEDIQQASLPSEVGTREFLQALRMHMQQLQQVVVHWYAIGVSAVRLYIAQMMSAPAPVR